MKKTTTGFALPPELLEWVREEAGKHGISMSAFVTMELSRMKRERDAR